MCQLPVSHLALPHLQEALVVVREPCPSHPIPGVAQHCSQGAAGWCRCLAGRFGSLRLGKTDPQSLVMLCISRSTATAWLDKENGVVPPHLTCPPGREWWSAWP